jgi:hypothetical protein
MTSWKETYLEHIKAELYLLFGLEQVTTPLELIYFICKIKRLE